MSKSQIILYLLIVSMVSCALPMALSVDAQEGALSAARIMVNEGKMSVATYALFEEALLSLTGTGRFFELASVALGSMASSFLGVNVYRNRKGKKAKQNMEI